MIEDKWINFVLLNGWRIKAEVDEATGDLVLLLSNEQGNISDGRSTGMTWLESSVDIEEIKAVYKLSVNE